LQVVPPLPQLITCVVPLIPVTEPFWVPSKVTVNTGSGTGVGVRYWEVTVTRIEDVITEVLPLVVTPIAVTVVESVRLNAGSACDVTSPVGETDATPGELDIQVTVLVRFWTCPLPERLPIARSCAEPPGPTNDCAPGMMIRVGVCGVVAVFVTVSNATAETAPDSAVINVVPYPVAVASPAVAPPATMVATCALLELHV